MTDNDIIKALECCVKAPYCSEKTDCPYKGIDDCVKKHTLDAIDLINRQKAENERLQKENEILSTNADDAFQQGLNESRELFKQEVETEIKTEAIKEFAERLKDDYIKDKRYDRPNAHTKISFLFNKIDNLMKEMVGDSQ